MTDDDWPGDGAPGDDADDNDWPDDDADDDWPGEDADDNDWPRAAGRPTAVRQPSGGNSHALRTMAVAVVAAAAGALLVMLVTGSLTGSQPSASPAATAPGYGGGGYGGGGYGGGGYGGGGGGGGGGMLITGGTVSKVSPTSITLSGGARTITAAITGATKFSGVSGASGIKVGDRVMAQITGYGSSHPVAVAVSDQGS